MRRRPCPVCRFRRARVRAHLCGVCAASATIRASFAGERPAERCGPGDFFGKASLPLCPTADWPGSAGRIAVYAERAGRKEALHHPRDFSPGAMPDVRSLAAVVCGPVTTGETDEAE